MSELRSLITSIQHAIRTVRNLSPTDPEFVRLQRRLAATSDVDDEFGREVENAVATIRGVLQPHVHLGKDLLSRLLHFMEHLNGFVRRH